MKQLRIVAPEHVDDLVVTDINADGWPDIVTMDTYEKNRLRVFTGDSKQLYTRQFVRAWSKIGLVILGAGDVTGDGRPDVVVDTPAGDALFAIFAGQPDGSLRPPKVIKPTDREEPDFSGGNLVDLDGDGRIDIAGILTSYQFDSPRSVAALFNLGGSKFALTRIADDVIFYGITRADFDGDGLVDVVVRDGDPGTVSLFRQLAGRTFDSGSATNVGASGEGVLAGDLDGDARIDLVGNGEDSELGWVLRGKANGAFTAPKKIPSSTGRMAERMAIGNIISGPANDLVSASSSTAYLYEGLGGGRLKAPLAVGPGFGYVGNVALADVNKDGKLDLITSHFHNFEAYDGPSDYELSSLLVFLNGVKPSVVTISNLSLTSLTYSPASSGQGTVTAVGSVSFQDSGGDVRYTGAADPSQSAFLEFHVTAVFPNNSWVASGNYRVSGPYMNLPGQKSGTIAFNLSLPIRSQGVGTPTLSISGFRLYDVNLVRSNDLARR